MIYTKKCPKCFAVYDDTWTVCLRDSEKLIIPRPGDVIETHRLKSSKFNHLTGFYFFAWHALIFMTAGNFPAGGYQIFGGKMWMLIDILATLPHAVVDFFMADFSSGNGAPVWVSELIFYVFGGIQWYLIGGFLFRRAYIPDQVPMTQKGTR